MHSTAFLCLAHNNFAYLEALSKYCTQQGNGFYLHLDKRVARPKNLALAKNTTLLSTKDSYATKWGTIDIVDATMKLLEKAKNKGYDHYVLISGSDIPLHDMSTLTELVTQSGNSISIWREASLDEKHVNNNEFFKRHHYQLPLANPGFAYATKNRVKIYLMLMINKVISCLPLQKSIFNFKKYYKGSQWFCLKHDAADYLVKQWQNKQIRKQFITMHAPDEKVIQTLLLNSDSPFKFTIDYGQTNTKQGLHFINWQETSREPILQDIPINKLQYIKQDDVVFARKMDVSEIAAYVNYVEQLTQEKI